MSKSKTPAPKSAISPNPIAPTASTSTKFWLKSPVPQLVLFTVAAVTFVGVLSNDFVYFDDHEAIWNNPALQKPSLYNFFSGQNLGMYAPVTWIFYWIGQHISGKEAWGYHLLSVLIHAANAVLVFQLLRSLLQRQWPAFGAALLFAIHPMQTEAIAWAAALSALLFTAFYLGSWIAYINWVRQRTSVQLGVSVLLFILACLAKSAAVTLPLMLIVCDWLFFSGSGSWQVRKPVFQKLLMNKAFYLIPALAFGLYTFSTRAMEGQTLAYVSSQFTVLDRFWMVAQTTLFYAIQLFLPFHYSINYPFVKFEGVWPLSYYIAPVVLLVLGWLVWRFWRNRAEYLFAVALFLLPLSLMLPLQTVGKFELRADRYAYLSCVGIFLLLMYQAEQLKPMFRNGILVAAALVLTLFTQMQIGVWKKDVTLFQNCVDQQPESTFCHCNLAYSLMKIKDYENAIVHYTETMNQDPIGWQLEVYNGRGRAYLQLKKVPEALADFNSAINMGMRTEQLLTDRGRCLTMLKRFPEAIPDFDACIAIGSKNPDVYFFRGFCFEKASNLEKAIADYSQAIVLRPEYMAAIVNRGFLYQNTKNYPAALEDYNKALQIDPEQPMVLNNRANVYLSMNQLEKALQDANKAAKINPEYSRVYQTRAQIYQALGKAAEAQADLAKLRQLGAIQAQ